MFKKQDDDMNSPDEALAAAWDQLAKLDVDSEEYASASESLSKLLSAKAQHDVAKGKITSSQVFGAGATTLLAFIGLNYERLAPITTKVFSYIRSVKL